MKSGEGGVVETSWMFQAASPASIHPARSPTRGSGLGATVEKGRWDGAHAATDNATIANHASDFTEGSLKGRSEEHTSELQSRLHLVCRLLLEKKKKRQKTKQEDTIVTRHTI